MFLFAFIFFLPCGFVFLLLCFFIFAHCLHGIFLFSHSMQVFFFHYPWLAVCVCWLNPFVREKVQNANRSFNHTFSPSTWNPPTKIKFLTLNVFGRTLPSQDTGEDTYLAWIILRRKHNINQRYRICACQKNRMPSNIVLYRLKCLANRVRTIWSILLRVSCLLFLSN